VTRLKLSNPEQAAVFSAAAGFGENFFGSGQLYALVEQYQSDRGLDATTTEVEIFLRDGQRFKVESVRVASRYLVFYSEDDEHVCVPYSEVVKVRIARRAKPIQRQTGFTVERLDEPASTSSIR